jgi:hypothetical protein
MKKALWISALVCMLAATPARLADKAAIDRALDRGISSLREMQTADGSWVFKSTMSTQASVGATALAALTLLECGVPSDDPQVVSAARYVRSKLRRANNRLMQSPLDNLLWRAKRQWHRWFPE